MPSSHLGPTAVSTPIPPSTSPISHVREVGSVLLGPLRLQLCPVWFLDGLSQRGVPATAEELCVGGLELVPSTQVTDLAEAAQGVMGGVQASGLRPPGAGTQLILLHLLPSFSPACTTEARALPFLYMQTSRGLAVSSSQKMHS